MARSVDPVNLNITIPELGKLETSGGGWHFQQDHPHEWVWFANGFTPAELDAIIRLGEQMEMTKGVTGGGNTPEVRDSFVSWLYPNDVTAWVFERMAGIVTAMNHEFFGFDLTGLLQGLQFTKYTAPGQHYTWHCDRGGGMGVRKMSVSLLLSDPDDYDGGDLQFKFGEEEQTAERERGIMTLFPSWSLHRVTPVTRGTRYSLVAWTSGPPFK